MKNKQLKKFKEVFGANPRDPWSAKYGIAEGSGLNDFLKSRGMNPKTMDREKKSAWARSDAFKTWATNRPVSSSTYQYKTASEEVEIEETKEPTGKLKNACWSGYTAVGMKMKGGRKVPNCVPVKEQDTAELHSKNVHKHVSDLANRVHVHKPQGTVKTEQLHIEPNESVMHDQPEGTITKVMERKRQMSKAARMIKAIYKKNRMSEELYDHEKDNKDPAKTKGKQPKLEKADEKENKGENKPQAAATLSGGKTMTGQQRDIIEIDPMMRNRPGQPDITKKDDKKKDDKKDDKKDKK
jgi:hypothetical protein